MAGDRLDYIKMLGMALIVALLIMLIKVIRDWSRKTGAVLQALELGKAAEEMRRQTPCSVNGMTRILLPRIAEDFPEFTYPEFKARAENLLLSYFSAITAGQPDLLSEPSPVLREQVRQEIDHQKMADCRTAYSEVVIHQTELADYRRQDGECRVVFQSAVGYQLQTGQGEPEQLQTRYNVELLYIQDAEAARAHQLDAAFSLNCPNCGAPIRNLGSKFCEFCGTAVQEVNQYAWSFGRIYEDNCRKG